VHNNTIKIRHIDEFPEEHFILEIIAVQPRNRLEFSYLLKWALSTTQYIHNATNFKGFDNYFSVNFCTKITILLKPYQLLLFFKQDIL